MHGRISFPAALPGRLARRQRATRAGRRSDAESWREQRAAFSARNDGGLEALSLSGAQPRAARAAGANGGASLEPAAVSDSEESRGGDRTEAPEWRCHWNH